MEVPRGRIPLSAYFRLLFLSGIPGFETQPGAMARLIRHVYEADPLLCRCGEEMRVGGFITRPPVILKTLRHVGRRFDPLILPGPTANSRRMQRRAGVRGR